MTALETVEIRSLEERDIESLWETINSVCQEKWFLASVEGFTLEQCREFHGRGIEKAWPQVVAVDKGRAVGWCNVATGEKVGFTHVGLLGMGVHRDYRRQGIGRRLLVACLSTARQSGLEKVELAVYRDNHVVIQLYENLGFEQEGCRKLARKFEGRYQDIHLMGLWV